MRIAIAMRTYESDAPVAVANADQAEPTECFAEFEVDEQRSSARESAEEDELVQVTVVLRGKRGELEDPALGMTELVLRALEARTDRGRDVIDAMGIAVEPAYAS